METEKASHDTEENLLLAQFGIVHDANKLITATKLQNGSQPQVGVPTQIKGDENWDEYKQSERVTSLKRERENSNSLDTIQGLLDQESYMMNGDSYMKNGEMKRVLPDQSLLVQQPKKLRMNSDITGDTDMGSGLVDNLSDLTNLTEFGCNALPNETKVEKRNHNFPKGDIFSFSRNKDILIPNGDVASPTTMEGTPDDLLEKSLSQYYPEQVSIAPQTSGSHPNTVNGSMTGELSNHAAHPPLLTSGYLNAVQMNSEHQQPGTANNTKESKNYNSAPYVVNGYSNKYGEHQHQQQQQKPFSGQERKLSLGQLSDMSPATNTSNSLQTPENDTNSFPKHSNSRVIYGKANREFNQNPYIKHNNSQKTDEGCFRPFTNPGMNRDGQDVESGSGKHNANGIHYRMQHLPFQQHSGNSCGGPQKSQSSGVGNGMEAGDNISQQKISLSHHAPNQRGWIDLGSPQQQPANGQPSQSQEHMWRSFPSRPQPEQTANSQAQSQMLESDTVQILQTQGGFKDNSQVDCLPAQSHCTTAQHNTAPEWQQSNIKTTPSQQPLSQKLPQVYNLPQQQHLDSRYRTNMQPEHLCEGDPELQEILSPGCLPQQNHSHEDQQQRPLSHPSPFEGQQLKSPIYRPHSQPQPGQQQIQTIRNSPGLSNPQHPQHSDQVTFSYNNTEMHQQLQRQYAPNSGSSTLQQYPPQQSTPKCYQSHHNNFPISTTQSQNDIPQGTANQQVTTQTFPKAEPQQHESCAQMQRGPQLPLSPSGPQGDFQRHAALRMHLLQRQGPSHSPDFNQGLRAVKMENGPQFEPPKPHEQDQLLQGQDMGMGKVQVKQEHIPSICKQSRKQGSILATMEQSLQQYQLSPVFENKSLVINSSKVKVESSGAVTVLSTNTDLLAGVNSSYEGLKGPPEFTLKKEPLLKSFIDSPMKLLDTPIKNLLDTPMKTQYDIASCHCVEQISEKDEGPYYTHLGAAPSVAGIREIMEKRSGLTGSAIRIEKVIYTGKEGKSTQGCPIAKWVIRRSDVEEKLVVLVRERSGHTCEHACIIIVILIWEGIAPSLADRLYIELSDTLTKHGAHTQRRCALNEERTCACQGLDPEASGASFSFGCSWSMYYNGCKFARSKIPRKFKLLGDDPREEENLEQNLQNLATLLAPKYKAMAPEAYGNQVEHEQRGPDCRLGQKEGRPFSGVTACMDFCAHAHRDLHNMQGGSTVVCTLTREDNREIGKLAEDEQLHVLPLYKASNTDEYGSEEGQQEKIKSGAVQVLSAFRRQVRMLAEPAKSCRQKKLDAKKAAANKNVDTPKIKAEKALHAKSKAGTLENSTQSNPGTGPIPGVMEANSQPSQPLLPLGTHPQPHHNMLPAYPGAPHPVNYPRFTNHPGLFPSTSQPGSMYPQPPTPASPYPAALHVPTSFMNGSNHPYPGYQCNGGMPLDNYHAYYASNPKHLDMYRQSPTLCPEQQYNVHQRYEIKYPQRYSDPGLQVNGYSTCSMRPRIQPMAPYSPYGPNGASDTQYIDGISRAPSGHPNMDYAAPVSKGNQLAGYPNPYLSQSPQIYPSGQDPFRMQIKTELGVPSPQVLPTLGGECLTSVAQSGLGIPNGSFLGASVKQEPPQTPTTPQKPEMWSDSEHNFLDPDIGGVAVAPTHGSILIECAKRELHATTPIKNPDRQHPTRISLVFYQHKNLNEAKHGLAMWEAKMAEKAREKEEDAEKNGGEGTPSKSSKKGAKREHPEYLEPSGEPPYKRFIQTLIEGSLSCTTNTYVSTTPYAFTKVTGPYSRFV